MKQFMNNQQQTIEDFVIVPRKIRDDYQQGKLTKNEFDILIWIWLNTNPYNGSFLADYKALEREFQNKISYDNMRKIISSLRKNQYIYFLNHKGRKGSFQIYPIGFLLTNKKIQTLDYLKNKLSFTNQSQSNTQVETELRNKYETQYHNLKEQKNILIKRFSMDSQNSKITNSYNDNNTKNNNIIDNKKFLKDSKENFSYNKKIIKVESFCPNDYGEQLCLEIAKSLGEKDMRFILSYYRKYRLNFIERAWGIFKEIQEKRTDIQNPRKYFNKLIRNLAKRVERKQDIQKAVNNESWGSTFK